MSVLKVIVLFSVCAYLLTVGAQHVVVKAASNWATQVETLISEAGR